MHGVHYGGSRGDLPGVLPGLWHQDREGAAVAEQGTIQQAFRGRGWASLPLGLFPGSISPGQISRTNRKMRCVPPLPAKPRSTLRLSAFKTVQLQIRTSAECLTRFAAERALLPAEPSRSARVCCQRLSFRIPGAPYIQERLILKLVVPLAPGSPLAPTTHWVDCGLEFAKKASSTLLISSFLRQEGKHALLAF
jgi:hypothetical protein